MMAGRHDERHDGGVEGRRTTQGGMMQGGMMRAA